MRRIDLTADTLVSALLGLAAVERVCILDSCGVGHLGSHLMIAGIRPVESAEISCLSPQETLAILDEKISSKYAVVFSISYDFGVNLQNIRTRHKPVPASVEPDVFYSLFDLVIVHDYDTRESYLTGNETEFDKIEFELRKMIFQSNESNSAAAITSDFSRLKYLSAIETIKELIRSGDTYQTNLTRKITAQLPIKLTPESIFWRLRRMHPAPFSAFLKRDNSTVISASPERFFRIDGGRISTSPIKGTRPRGSSPAEDAAFRKELLHSQKDLAENTMIVDLLRNDLGRICEYGTVQVEKLCEIEEHPSLFHLVSTISGVLRKGSGFNEILMALFPSGSITGAPKINTMRVIDRIETANRGLSMGSIGYRMPDSFGIGESIDLSVAIRTMNVRGNEAEFNVGGGIVIDSDPASEYEETVVKSYALLHALGVGVPI